MVESGTDLSGLDVLAGIVGCAGMEERACYGVCQTRPDLR